ncbi:MAG TPA: DUF5362 family protein [Flavitalea sp.]|nr:DUF5362 family protein [Flavitalea sp.]
MSQENVQLFDLHVDHEGTQYLAQAAKWGRFLSIIGFVMIGLMVVFSLFAGSIFAKAFATMGDANNAGTMAAMGGFGGVFTVIYMLIAALWLMPVIYLYRFSTRMLDALRANDQHLLNTSFKNLKSCFRFVGITTIVVLSIYAFIIVISIGALAVGN